MFINREQFWAAALVINAASAGCDLRGHLVGQPEPEPVASTAAPAASGAFAQEQAAPAASGDDGIGRALSQPKTASKPSPTKERIVLPPPTREAGLRAPTQEGAFPGPTKERVAFPAPTKEGYRYPSPTKEAGYPTGYRYPSPTKER
jgi:hypothetical protein